MRDDAVRAHPPSRMNNRKQGAPGLLSLVLQVCGQARKEDPRKKIGEPRTTLNGSTTFALDPTFGLGYLSPVSTPMVGATRSRQV